MFYELLGTDRKKYHYKDYQDNQYSKYFVYEFETQKNYSNKQFIY